MGAKGKRKSLAGVSSDQSYGSAAHRVVLAAMKEVLHWLPLAAERLCADDGENVHRLRVSTRRASVALKAFSDLLDPTDLAALRDDLRKIRQAADGARNIDATFERFLSHSGACGGDGMCSNLRERLLAARQDAQAPIVAMNQKISGTDFSDRIQLLLSDLNSRHPRRSVQTFGKRARNVLKPAIKKFFKASEGDLSTDDALHHLRIQAKKLRYTMEIVAVAFGPSFAGKLYQEFCEFQDVMGAIRDRVIMEQLLRAWLQHPAHDAERDFFENLLRIEKTTHAELMCKFKTLWTKKYVKRLKRDFKEHMDSK